MNNSHWFDEVVEGWEVLRLKRAVILSKARTDERPNDLRYIGLENIESWTGRLLGSVDKEIGEEDVAESSSVVNYFEPGDVLFGKLRPYLAKAHLVTEHSVGTTELLALKTKQNLHGRFLLYVLLSPGFIGLVNSSTFGSKMPRADWEFIGNVFIPRPSLAEQQAIADLLDRETAQLDNLIAEKERLLKLLAEKRRALITRIVTYGLNPNTKLQDTGLSWLGRIPIHWRTIRLKFAISKIDQGWSPQCYNYPAEEGQWGVLKTGCVNGGAFNPEENKTLPDNIEPPLEIEVNLGDVLMSRASGSTELIGSVALVNERSRARLLLSDKTYRIHLQADIVNPRFFVLLMGSAVLRCQIGAIISGAEGLANNIAQSDIRELLIILPPLDEQCDIAEYAESQIKKLDALRGETEQTINLLTERRAALIAAAITGHLSVEGET